MHLRLSFLVFGLIWPLVLSAQVASHWQSQLWMRWLPALELGTAEERWQARLAFLTWPEASLPVLREGIATAETPENWRLAQLLAQLGEESDIPRLLDAWQQLSSTRQEVWLGSLERLYWKYRQKSPQNLLLTRFQFIPTEDVAVKSGLLRGEIVYKIANSTAHARLVRVRLNSWRGQTDPYWSDQIHWLEAGNAVEVSLPVTLRFDPRVLTVRLDLDVREVGAQQSLLHERHEVAISGKPAPPSSRRRQLDVPTQAAPAPKKQSEEAEEG